jgi:pyruvate dehydrogenase E2 component (dihydrolipoamide acetyltransferase)
MPQLGETVTEGTITRWLKQVGDAVAEDEVLFEVSTDKVDSEVPSPAAGVVSEILVAEGDTVDVGTRLAVISDGAAAPASAPAAESAPVEAPAPQAGTAAPVRPESPAESLEPEPAAETAGSDEAAIRPAAATSPVPRAAAAAAGRESPGEDRAPAEGDSGKVLSPVVRRLISENNLDAAQIRGTGAGGRITRSDVLAIIDRQSTAGPNGNGRAAPPAAGPPAASAPAASAPAAGSSPAAGGGSPPAPAATPKPAPAAPAATPFAPATAGDRDTIVPFTNIRRRTAEHMIRSKATSAHAMVAVDVDYSAVEKVRAAQKTAFRAAEGIGLNYLPFISRAVVDVLADYPIVNSSVGDDALIVHNAINLGIAVDLDFEGLLVPVIHDADGKRLRQIAREIAGLATKARSKRLTMDDISGGTITLTNAGPFGTLITVPVINQPQVAIISTDGVRKKPVAIEMPDGTDAIAIHPVGNLVMSWDHRAFDGAYAAAFLSAVRTVLETRDWSVEL